MDLSYLTVQQPEFDGSLHLPTFASHSFFPLSTAVPPLVCYHGSDIAYVASFILWIADDRIRTIYRSYSDT